MEQLPRVVAYSWLFQPKLELPDPPRWRRTPRYLCSASLTQLAVTLGRRPSGKSFPVPPPEMFQELPGAAHGAKSSQISPFPVPHGLHGGASVSPGCPGRFGASQNIQTRITP